MPKEKPAPATPDTKPAQALTPPTDGLTVSQAGPTPPLGALTPTTPPKQETPPPPPKQEDKPAPDPAQSQAVKDAEDVSTVEAQVAGTDADLTPVTDPRDGAPPEETNSIGDVKSQDDELEPGQVRLVGLDNVSHGQDGKSYAIQEGAEFTVPEEVGKKLIKNGYAKPAGE